MSALLNLNPGRPPEQDSEPRPSLRAVRRPQTRLSRVPFVIVLILVVALGMGGLLFLNTSLQAQSFEAGDLDTRAARLGYDQAALQRTADQLETPDALAAKATKLGMRPNPEPAFLVLPSGKVLGDAEPVTGQEAPNQIVKSAAQLKAEAEARKAAKQEAKIAAQKQAAAKKLAAQKKAAAKKAADQKAADQKAADQKADNKAADDKAADDKSTDSKER